MPKLNDTLKFLSCYNNSLIRLPELNHSLKYLYCSDNQLTILPKLNNELQILECFDNQLTILPELNDALEMLVCDDNSFPSFISINSGYLNQENKNRINNEFQRLYRFKLLFWSLKYKTKLRDLLWIRVRLPKIEKMYDPSKLNELLNADMSEEELDNVISDW